MYYFVCAVIKGGFYACFCRLRADISFLQVGQLCCVKEVVCHACSFRFLSFVNTDRQYRYVLLFLLIGFVDVACPADLLIRVARVRVCLAFVLGCASCLFRFVSRARWVVYLGGVHGILMLFERLVGVHGAWLGVY